MAIPPADVPGILITLKDVYQRQVSDSEDIKSDIANLRSQVMDIKAKQDLISNTGIVATHTTDDHESRLRSLERWKYSIPPAIMAALVSLIVTLIDAVNRSFGNG